LCEDEEGNSEKVVDELESGIIITREIWGFRE